MWWFDKRWYTLVSFSRPTPPIYRQNINIEYVVFEKGSVGNNETETVLELI